MGDIFIGIGEIPEPIFPFEAIVKNGLGRLEVERVLGAPVHPVSREAGFHGADTSPLIIGPIRRRIHDILEVALEELQDARIARGLVVLGENLQRDREGPAVLILHGTEPAGILAGHQHVLDIGLNFGDQPLIIQEIGQGNQPIQIVGAALPGISIQTLPGGGEK